MTIDELADSFGITFEMDGNMWCAKEPDFVNLQESNAGFGSTKEEALRELSYDRPDLDIFHSHSLECSPGCGDCESYPCICDETPDDERERHGFGCICADCSGAELTAEND